MRGGRIFASAWSYLATPNEAIPLTGRDILRGLEMTGKATLLAGCATLAFFAFEGRAFAQSAAPDEPVRLDEVVVTAEKREDSLQDAPVAISAYTSKQRDVVGIRTIQDMANFTPGLSYSTSLDRISLRGVGRLTNAIGSDPGVATYNDGFYTSSTVEASKTPMFVDRVEVLRGPQGTLYGRNSIGGAINVISKRPTSTLQGEVRATGETYDYNILEGWVSGPITDAVGYRLSVQYGPHQGDGYFTNIANGRDEGKLGRVFVEGQLEFDPSDTLNIWLKYSHAVWDDDFRSANLTTPYATGGNFIPGTATSLVPPNGLVPNPAFGYTTSNPGVVDVRKYNTDTAATQTLDDNHTFVLQATLNMGWADLKYVGGYQTYLYKNYSDLDYTARKSFDYPTIYGSVTIFPTYIQEYIEDKTYYSNELNLVSTGDGPLQWIAGLYQYHEDFYQPVTWYAPNQVQLRTPINISGALPADPNPRGAFYAGTGDLSADSYAAFGQIDYQFNDVWSLTAGLRYSYDEKDGLETYRLVNFDPSAIVPGCPGGCGPFTSAFDVTASVTGAVAPGGLGTGAVVRRVKGDWSLLSGRIQLGWKPDDSTLGYLSYSRGGKSGGFNLGSWSPNPVVDPEKVDAFEAGIKKDFGRTLRLNAAVFYYDYRNPQVPLPTFNGGVVTTNFINIDKARSLGFELEANWAPTDDLQFLLSYAWLDATIRDSCCFVDESDPLAADAGANPIGPLVGGRQPQKLDGNRLPSSPRNKIALNGRYSWHFAPGDLTASVSYIWRDETWYSVFTTDRFRADSFDQVDARLTFTDADNRFTVIGFVRNAFDEQGYDGVASANGTGATGFGRIVSFTPPRTYGVELQYRF
ncbi:MAG: TonB-dependent receptor [Caulobacter sp.]|nr:TonB-dependent receptor [Caulobacter sp.]